MREDIQCLRGIAIILVILFHMAPDNFPNGFLGVDIFFVVSGFLMSKKLTGMSLWEFSSYWKFYYLRFRRILPMYYLCIFGTTITVHWFLADFLWENNHRYSLASLLLVTNQLVIHDQSDYFKAFSASIYSLNAYIHLWSLSVEMQFYLLVPFIFLGLQVLKKDYLKIIAVTIMAVCTFIGFILAEKSFSFNFMFLRLWQFLAGFLAMFWSRIKNKETSKTSSFELPVSKSDIVIVCLCILGICIIPQKIQVLYLRPLITIVTAIVIAAQVEGIKILQSPVLGYIGDISYVLYLVHWPVLRIFLDGTTNSYIFCILTMFIISITIHHLLEKPFLQFGIKVTGSLILTLILANAALQYSVQHHPSFWKRELPKEIQEVIDKNLAASMVVWEKHNKGDAKCTQTVINFPLPEYGLLRFCSYTGSGKSSIMMLGNSYIVNFGENMRAHFNENYSEWRYISARANYGLYTDDTLQSQQSMRISKHQVELHKPDVLIIVARYDYNIKDKIRVNDTVLQEINDNVVFYEKFVKKLYIMNALPRYPDGFLNRFLFDVMSSPEHLNFLHLNKKEVEKEMSPVKKRFSKIECGKCQFFDLSNVFLQGEKYVTFDESTMMSYADNTAHLTPAAIELCEPVFEKLAKQVIKDF